MINITLNQPLQSRRSRSLTLLTYVDVKATAIVRTLRFYQFRTKSVVLDPMDYFTDVNVLRTKPPRTGSSSFSGITEIADTVLLGNSEPGIGVSSVVPCASLERRLLPHAIIPLDSWCYKLCANPSAITLAPHGNAPRECDFDKSFPGRDTSAARTAGSALGLELANS